jgi:hypothetical protein
MFDWVPDWLNPFGTEWYDENLPPLLNEVLGDAEAQKEREREAWAKLTSLLVVGALAVYLWNKR